MFVPATGYMFDRLVGESHLTAPQIGLSLGIGGIVQVAVIASLYLNMNIGWRGQRLTGQRV